MDNQHIGSARIGSSVEGEEVGVDEGLSHQEGCNNTVIDLNAMGYFDLVEAIKFEYGQFNRRAFTNFFVDVGSTFVSGRQ